MICPACSSEMTEVIVAGIAVDVCKQGCGGIWFDQFEFKKLDNAKEGAGEALLPLEISPTITVDHTKERHCPRCADQKLRTHFYSVKQKVQIDECYKCAGVFLDVGELRAVRTEFQDNSDQERSALAFYGNVVEQMGQNMIAEREESKLQSSQVKELFQFLCPSKYLPGKQDWGNF